jgi:hypothetical protein
MHKFLTAYCEKRARQRILFLESIKGGSMKGQMDIKICVLRPPFNETDLIVQGFLGETI